MSIEGDSVDFSHVTQDRREALYNEVWTDPVTTVAKRYDMSDNGLRKHCKRLWIPLPPNGYWAKIKAGQKVSKPELPRVRGELKNYVSNYVIKYRPDIDQLTDAEMISDHGFSLLTEETKAFIRDTCSKIQVKGQLRSPNNLITEHKEEVIYRNKRDKALQKASFNPNYYAIQKNKYRDNIAILPIEVSEANINRAYRLIDTMISTLDDMEGYIRVGKESGKDTGYFGIMHSVFYFEVKEETKRKRASKNDDELPTYLVLSMSAKSWFWNDNVIMEYKDTDNALVESQIGKIIYDMFVLANRFKAEEMLRDREKKRKEEERERQRRLEKMRKGELEEVKFLEQAASDWDKAQKIRRFADSVEFNIAEETNTYKKEKLTNWLKWVRDKADWLDPLTAKEDELLGKNKHIFDLIRYEDY